MMLVRSSFLKCSVLIVFGVVVSLVMLVHHAFLPENFVTVEQTPRTARRWQEPRLPGRLFNADPDSSDLIAHIRDLWLIPPSDEPLQLAKPGLKHYSQIGQSELVDKLLKEKRDGFFVECGAGNGERLSNSLFFEKERNWTGLLIEPNPDNFEVLVRKHRHAHLIKACVSPEPQPMGLTLRLATLASALEEYTDSEHSVKVLRGKGKYRGSVRVQCFPLTSILQAVGVRTIDYFSLDVEGSEIHILETFPFESFNITTFSIEYDIMDKDETARKRSKILKIMAANGYDLVKDLKEQDLIFVKGQTNS